VWRGKQEIAGRRVGPDSIAGGDEQALERRAQRFVIVDDMDDWWIRAHADAPLGPCATPAAAVAAARRTRNVAPPCTLFSARMDPPCASTIDLTMARPSPMPSAFVDQNESNRCAKFSGAIPCPRSATAISTDPFSASEVLTAAIRWEGGVSVIASIALIRRL